VGIKQSKLLAGLLCMILMLSIVPITQATVTTRVVVNGRLLYMDVQPIVVDGRTLVPLRAIFESLGATLEWDSETSRILGVKGDIRVDLFVGSRTAVVNGRTVMLDLAPTIVSGRTMVPVRFIAESLGAKVLWDEATRTVDIRSLVYVESIVLEASAVTLRLGEPAVRLRYTLLPEDATDKEVTWRSMDTGVATVSSAGLVSAIALGTTQVIATTRDGNRQAICHVTVTPRFTGIRLDNETATLRVGEATQLLAKTIPTHDDNAAVTWSTSDHKVAIVSATGLVTAVAAGTATVTVTLIEGGKQASCVVVVLPAVVVRSFPPRFDLRDTRALSPINEQGSMGTCWAVALIDSLESTTWVALGGRELSVYNMAVQTSRQYSNGFDREHGWGGMAEIGLAYLASWRGPVLEKSDPYFDNAKEVRLTTNTRPVMLVQGATLFPNRTHALDNAAFKAHLMEHGAIYVSKWKGTPSTFGRFYNQETFAWYYPHDHLTPEGNGHAVTIVGWDDNFPKEAFNAAHRPPGNGAFIVRNTKGANWGSLIPGRNMGGYFFISYYDTKIGQTMFGYPNETGAVGFTRVDQVGKYDFIYQHDMLGYNDRYRAQANHIAMRNEFIVGLGHTERLSAVSFYALAENIQYEVWLHRNLSAPGSSGNAVMVGRGSFELPGYYTVDLIEEVDLTPRERIGVEVRLRAVGPVSFAIDSATGYASSTSEYKPNVSFVHINGKWVDLHSVTPQGKACIKIFTRDRGPAPQHMLTSQIMRAELDIFIRNLREKQAEFLRGFTPAQQKIVDNAYAHIAQPRSIREFNLVLKRLLSMAGDGHAVVNITNAHSLNRGGLELEFVWLSDGLYVLNAADTLRPGDKIVGVGALTTAELMTTMRQTFATENDYFVRYNVNNLLRTETYLREYGVVNLNNTVDFVVERGDKRIVAQVLLRATLRHSQGVARQFYEWRIERENKLGYFKFNYWPNDQEPDRAFYLELEGAIHEFFEDVRQDKIDNIVIDVRDNNGGWAPIWFLLGEYFVPGGITPRRPHITMKDPANFFKGRVYYLQGYGSFSKSVHAVAPFEETKGIVIIGEESGQRPNFNQGSTFHDLVHVPGRYRLSASIPPLKSFQRPSDDTIHPEVRIPRRIEDILVGRDIQLERLREITRGGNYNYAAGTLEVPLGGKVTLAQGPAFSVQSATITLPFDVTRLPVDHFWLERPKTRERVASKVTIASSGVTLESSLAMANTTYHLMIRDGERTYGVLVSFQGVPGVVGELRAISNSMTRWNYYIVSFNRDLSTVLDRSKVTLTDGQGRTHGFHLERPAVEPFSLLIVMHGRLPPGVYTITVQEGAVSCLRDNSLKNRLLRFTFQVNN